MREDDIYQMEVRCAQEGLRADMVAPLWGFYSQYNPKKLSEIPSILEEWQGAEEEMLSALRDKYHLSGAPSPPPPPHRPSPPPPPHDMQRKLLDDLVRDGIGFHPRVTSATPPPLAIKPDSPPPLAQPIPAGAPIGHRVSVSPNRNMELQYLGEVHADVLRESAVKEALLDIDALKHRAKVRAASSGTSARWDPQQSSPSPPPPPPPPPPAPQNFQKPRPLYFPQPTSIPNQYIPRSVHPEPDAREQERQRYDEYEVEQPIREIRRTASPSAALMKELDEVERMVAEVEAGRRTTQTLPFPTPTPTSYAHPAQRPPQFSTSPSPVFPMDSIPPAEHTDRKTLFNLMRNALDEGDTNRYDYDNAEVSGIPVVNTGVRGGGPTTPIMVPAPVDISALPPSPLRFEGTFSTTPPGISVPPGVPRVPGVPGVSAPANNAEERYQQLLGDMKSYQQRAASLLDGASNAKDVKVDVVEAAAFDRIESPKENTMFASYLPEDMVRYSPFRPKVRSASPPLSKDLLLAWGVKEAENGVAGNRSGSANFADLDVVTYTKFDGVLMTGMAYIFGETKREGLKMGWFWVGRNASQKVADAAFSFSCTKLATFDEQCPQHRIFEGEEPPEFFAMLAANDVPLSINLLSPLTRGITPKLLRISPFSSQHLRLEELPCCLDALSESNNQPPLFFLTSAQRLWILRAKGEDVPLPDPGRLAEKLLQKCPHLGYEGVVSVSDAFRLGVCAATIPQRQILNASVVRKVAYASLQVSSLVLRATVVQGHETRFSTVNLRRQNGRISVPMMKASLDVAGGRAGVYVIVHRTALRVWVRGEAGGAVERGAHIAVCDVFIAQNHLPPDFPLLLAYEGDEPPGFFPSDMFS